MGPPFHLDGAAHLYAANFTSNSHSFQTKSFKMHLFLVEKWPKSGQIIRNAQRQTLCNPHHTSEKTPPRNAEIYLRSIG